MAKIVAVNFSDENRSSDIAVKVVTDKINDWLRAHPGSKVVNISSFASQEDYSGGLIRTWAHSIVIFETP